MGKEGEFEARWTILDWVVRAGLPEKAIVSTNQKEARG